MTLIPTDLRIRPSRLAFAAVAAAGLLAPAGAGAAALGTNGAATPVIHWGACESALTDISPDFQCATVQVPLNYNKPTGTKITLALSRLPATGPGTKLGSVFFNSGGPGSASRTTPQYGTAKLRARFDLVGVDSRGTGLSTPVHCAATSEDAAAALLPPFPITPTQEATDQNLVSQGAAGCRSRNGEILTHLSSANSARDLELLRKAVGDAKLNFFSFSAGSNIGLTYAQLFPTTTRAIALDSPLDPVKYTTGTSAAEGQQPIDYRMKSYLGTDEAVTSFLAACAANPDTCAFADAGSTTASLRAKFNAVLARVRANNGVVLDAGGPDETTLSYQDLVGMIFGDLQFGIFTSQDIAGTLAAVDAASQGGGRIRSTDLQSFIDSFTRLKHFNDPIDPTQPYDNFYDAFAATLCSETDHPSGGTPYVNYGRTANGEVAGFGPYWIWTTASCGFWTSKDTDRYVGPWTARPSTPVLMLSNKLGDVAARYANAQSAAALTGARLVGVNEYGHTTYALGSTCANDTVDDYLISLTVPPANKTCATDFGPFDPISEASVDQATDAGYRRVR